MVGTDIIEVNRIKNAMQNENFALRVFTQKEIDYCEKFNNDIKFQHYAARFAGKEAVFKAIFNKLNNKYEIDFKDIEIYNDKAGKPYVKINNKIQSVSNLQIDISLSHVKDYAIAVVEVI